MHNLVYKIVIYYLIITLPDNTILISQILLNKNLLTDIEQKNFSNVSYKFSISIKYY